MNEDKFNGAGVYTEANNITTPWDKVKAHYDPIGDLMRQAQQAPVAVEAPGQKMMFSTSLDKLAAALASAQAEIKAAPKDSTNPHFKSRYADLAAVWEACRGSLTKQGLSVVQLPSADGAKVTVTTMLLHTSGQWIRSDLTMTAQQATPQGIGSCITYARRYALSAVVGVAPDDDDGNAASTPGPAGAAPVSVTRKVTSTPKASLPSLGK